MNKFHRILSAVLVFAMCFSLAPVSALALDLPELDVLEDVVREVNEASPAEVELEHFVAETEQESETLLAASGTCSDNLTWTLSEDGVLTISGTGAMEDYDLWGSDPAPWYVSQSSVKIVVIEDGVTSVGDHAFLDCSRLESVTIPDGVTSIGVDAFGGCSNLTSITIPDSVTYIRDYAFSRCSNLTSIQVNSGNKNYCSVDGVLFTKDMTTLMCCPGGKTGAYTVPDSVTSIGHGVFDGCINLTSITIPNSVTSIGDSAFSRCSSLTSITIPDSVTSIGYGAFYGCINLTSITIPDSVTSIWDSAFCDCNRLESITIPNSVTSIGDSAFLDCSRLESITISDSVTSIGVDAFGGCSNLAEVYYTGSTEQWNAIDISEGNENLTTATIHCSDDDTGESEDSGYIASGTCGDDLTWTLSSDGLLTISGTGNIYNYRNYDEEIEAYIYTAPWLGYADVITEVLVEDGIGVIGSAAFASLHNLQTVTLGESVAMIRPYVFEGCGALQSITIPKSLIAVGLYAFWGCYELENVTFDGTEDDWNTIGIAGGNRPLLEAYGIEIGPCYITASTSELVLDVDNPTGSIKYTVSGNLPYTYELSYSLYDMDGDMLYGSSLNILWGEWDGTTIPLNFEMNGEGCFSLVVKLYDSAEPIIDEYALCSTTTTVRCLDYQCGDNLTWSYSDGTLEISGTGTMDDYSVIVAPWNWIDPSNIENIVINTGVTQIGNCAFETCDNLESISISADVSSIGKYAFRESSKLTDVYYEGTEEEWATISIADGNEYFTGATIHYNANHAEHIFGDWYVSKAPTCKAVGEKRRNCTSCDLYETEMLDIVAHTEITDAAVAPTCTETGLTEGSHCSVCGDIIMAQKEVALIDHTWDSGKVTKEPALNVDGVKTYTCSGCGGTKTEAIPAISADVTNNGTTDALDLIALMKHVVGAETASNTDALDVNRDGKIDILDIVRLVRYLSGTKQN